MGNKILYGIENHWDHPEYIKKERWMRCIFGDRVSNKGETTMKLIEEIQKLLVNAYLGKQISWKCQRGRDDSIIDEAVFTVSGVKLNHNGTVLFECEENIGGLCLGLWSTIELFENGTHTHYIMDDANLKPLTVETLRIKEDKQWREDNKKSLKL